MSAGAGEPSLRVVLCNCPPGDAEAIARAVVEGRLAACANIVPGVVSIYRWEGAICRDEESTVLFKTTAERVPALTEAIRALHPATVPEVISIPLAGGEGNDAYRAWVLAETTAATTTA